MNKRLRRAVDDLASVAHGALHQITTDSDLDHVTGAEKYRNLAKSLRDALLAFERADNPQPRD